MAIAIGSGSHAAASLGRSFLDAEITRYQKQLSDCVNYPFANTLARKMQIQALSHQISVGQRRIKQMESAANSSAASADTFTSVAESATNPAQVG